MIDSKILGKKSFLFKKLQLFIFIYKIFEPKRLGHRYCICSGLFIYYLGTAKLKMLRFLSGASTQAPLSTSKKSLSTSCHSTENCSVFSLSPEKK